MKKVKIIFAIIIGVLIVFFCLRDIFYQARTEVAFVAFGSKEVIGKIVKKEFSSRRRSTTYYITYEFSPEDSESITKKIRIDKFEWQFIREGQDISILYQEHNDEIFYRPKSWNLRSYDFFWDLVIVYTTASFMILGFWFIRVGKEEMQAGKYKPVKKKLGWMFYFVFCGILFLMSFSTLKFFFFSSSTKAHIEEIWTADNEFLFKYGFDDHKKDHHTITAFVKDEENFQNIEKHKNDIAIDIIYKKSDPEIHYFGKPFYNYFGFVFIAVFVFLVGLPLFALMKVVAGNDVSKSKVDQV